MHDDLLQLAKELAELDRGRPRQASLRRSISTAYYALFHALSDACVTALIGWHRRPWSWSVVEPAYRAIDHGAAKKVFIQLRTKGDTDYGVRLLAEAFIVLQDARLRADYDPKIRFVREDALQFAEQAAAAVAIVSAMSAAQRLELVVQLVFKQR